MKVAVVGSRGFNDYARLCKKLDYVTAEFGKIEKIISGGAKGADSLAARYADEKNIDKEIFYPEWDKYGKSAGMIRNELIIKDADIVVAMWDGVSKGTKNSISLAVQQKKRLIVDMYNEKPDTDFD